MSTVSQLIESRVQLHYAIQLIAAAGAALAQPQPDYSHTSLSWDDQLKIFAGNLIAADRPFRVGLDPIDLTALILDQDGVELADYALHQKTMAESLDWLQQEIIKLGADAAKVAFLTYPADFPDHPIAHGAKFDGQNAETRQLLSDYYACTNRLLQEIVKTTPDASAVHIWPHHFDMATLISMPTANESSIGIGLSPGDVTFDQPYWYVSPYPYPEIARLPQLETGSWHTAGWIGAVLTAAQLRYDTAESTQIEIFLHEALDHCKTLLAS